MFKFGDKVSVYGHTTPGVVMDATLQKPEMARRKNQQGQETGPEEEVRPALVGVMLLKSEAPVLFVEPSKLTKIASQGEIAAALTEDQS